MGGISKVHSSGVFKEACRETYWEGTTYNLARIYNKGQGPQECRYRETLSCRGLKTPFGAHQPNGFSRYPSYF